MSISEIKGAMEKKKSAFGIKETLKFFKKSKAKSKKAKVFVARDARDEIIKKLENAKIEFEVLKTKNEIAKELGVNFLSEVFLVK